MLLHPNFSHRFRMLWILVAVLQATTCVSNDTTTDMLSHNHTKSLFDEEEEIPDLFPFEWKDWIGFSCCLVGLMLAAGGGIGGGGILVPIYILIFAFPIKHAIPLASATVLGGAVANNLLNWNRKHPARKSVSCIDFDLLLQLEPMTIAGTLIGADLNDLLPDVVLVVFLLVLLTLTASKTLHKAKSMYDQESLELLQKRPDEELPLRASVNESSYHSTEQNATTTTLDQSRNEQRQKRIVIDLLKLLLLFTVITILNLLKGGPGEGGGPAGMEACGAHCFWLTELSMLALIVLFAGHVRQTVLRRVQADAAQQWERTSDIEWNDQNTLKFPGLAIVAGLAAGMFGIGGGIVKGPLMLALGVHPAVASATSACMILFTSSTATISYAVFGNLIYDYAAACLLMGFVATLIGHTLMTTLMEQCHQRHSYIAFSIGAVVALSAICMAIESIIALRR